MYENQLIQFAKAINPKECCVPVPIVFDRSGVAFYVPADEQANTIFTIVDASGEPLLHNGKELGGRFVNMRNNYVRFFDSGRCISHATSVIQSGRHA